VRAEARRAPAQNPQRRGDRGREEG
jgi:hypothetical protein